MRRLLSLFVVLAFLLVPVIVCAWTLPIDDDCESGTYPQYSSFTDESESGGGTASEYTGANKNDSKAITAAIGNTAGTAVVYANDSSATEDDMYFAGTFFLDSELLDDTDFAYIQWFYTADAGDVTSYVGLDDESGTIYLRGKAGTSNVTDDSYPIVVDTEYIIKGYYKKNTDSNGELAVWIRTPTTGYTQVIDITDHDETNTVGHVRFGAYTGGADDDIVVEWDDIMVSTTDPDPNGTYYVDATSGDDDDFGSSTSHPWKTMAKVNAFTLPVASTVYFKKGETWREQLTVPSSGTSGNVITFTSYDSGDDPIISGADIISTWSDEGGNVWSATLATEPNQIFYNEVHGTNEDGTCPGDLNTDGEWCWDSNVLYQHSSSDPYTRYTSPGTEASIRLNAIDGSDATDYIDITGLTVKHANGDGINTDSGDNWNITSVTANQNYRYGIRAGDNSDTIVIDSCVGSTDNLIGIGSNAASNVTVKNSAAQNNNYRSAADGMQFNTTSGLIVEYNVSSGNDNADSSSSDGIQLQKCPNAIVRYNYIYDNKNSGLLLSGDSGVYSYGAIHHNIIDGTGANHCLALSYIGDGNTVVYNNTLYGGQLRINDIESPHTLTVTNNIFEAGASNSVDENTDVDDSLITMDYNLIYNSSGTMITWEGNNYTQAQFASYQSTESQDANSISSDPLMTNPSSDDFTLASGSPCINTGTDLGATYDDALKYSSSWPSSVVTIDQDSYGDAWEIGAYGFSPRGNRPNLLLRIFRR